MEKSTVSALIIAGAGVLVAALQVFVLRAAKRKRSKDQAGSEERMRQFDSDHGIGGADSDL